jgi:3-phenylpropionate/trans-cinnamate dioxygenase ferredoxin reductase component
LTIEVRADRILIVGGSLAGLRTAEALRSRGFAGDLTIVGAEHHRPYDRPPLSKQLLAGTMGPEDCALGQHADLAAEWMLGRRAVSLDRSARRVCLDDGSEAPYDILVIATGCGSVAWPVPEQAALGGVHTLRSLDDALALRESVASASRVAVLGAGFIGCEVAATFRSAGLAVTLVDLLAQPMAPLGHLLGGWCAKLHETRGVDLRLGCRIAALEGHGRLTAVVLESGERIPVDAAVVALGARPEVAWLDGSCLELRGGVVTDRYGFADPERRIACVGDVAVFPHPLAGGGLVSIRHWSNAAEQARVVAANLLAEPAEQLAYEPVPSFWSDQYEVKIQSVGLPERATRVEVVDGGSAEERSVAVAWRDDELVGAIAFNSARRLGEYRRELAARMAQSSPAAA